MQTFYDTQESAVGLLLATATQDSLTSLWLGATPDLIDPSWHKGAAITSETFAQLKEYFARKRQSFSIPLAPKGTDFQKRVWALLEKIPYGATTSYGAIAKQLGDPNASRAVGLANGKNPIAIMIPCHRVIGKTGSLTGYAGGLPTKRLLLELEQSLLPLSL